MPPVLRRALAAAPVIAALLSCVAAAQEKTKLIPGDFSATLTIGSDYLYRGISQTDNNPTVQGSFDYAYAFDPTFGAYLGVWASNLDFNDGNEAAIETDVYAGLKGTVSGISWQFGGIGYLYPGARSGLNYDFFEIAGKVGYDFGFAEASVGLNYSPDFFAASGDAYWLYGDVKVPIPFLPLDAALVGHLGHQWIQRNDRFGTPDYLEWSAGVTATVEGFVLTLSYVDTDLSRGECFAGRDLCRARAVFTVSRSF